MLASQIDIERDVGVRRRAKVSDDGAHSGRARSAYRHGQSESAARRRTRPGAGPRAVHPGSPSRAASGVRGREIVLVKRKKQKWYALWAYAYVVMPRARAPSTGGER